MYEQDVEMLKNVVGITESKDMVSSLMYVDFNKDLEIGANTHNIELTVFDGVDFYETVTKSIIDTVDLLCEQHPTDVTEKLTLNMSDTSNDIQIFQRRVIFLVRSMSNLIAVNGRIGAGHWVALPKSFYNQYIGELEDREYILEKVECDLFGEMDVLVDSRINHIYGGRVNNKEQPGLLLIYKNDDTFAFELAQIGFYPHKQYLKIKIV
jgi:hypothetical protein